MRKIFTLLFALICCTMYADELYLVGDGTPIGWEGDGTMRQTTRMTETSQGVYVWTGPLKHGNEGFKICNSFNGWEGYHPSTEAFAIAESGTDSYTTSGNDWKWNPSHDDWKWYTITLDKNASTLSWKPASAPALQPVDGVYYIGTAEELYALAQLMNNNVDGKSFNVKLTADIDYTAYKERGLASVGATEKKPFLGEFDGQGHTVTVDMICHGTRTGFIGFNKGKVHDLKVAGKYTAESHNQIGGICGVVAADAKVYNCVSAVEVVDAQNGDGTIGGIAAVANGSAVIDNCASYVKISAPGRGGNGFIVGWADGGQNTTISNCLVVAEASSTECVDFGRNNPNVINSMKLAASEPKLASGDIAYELNGKVSGGIWGQQLGIDALPSPISSYKIYANGTFYCDGITAKNPGDFVLSNINAAVVDEHTIGEDGVCSVCHLGCTEPVEVDGVFQIANFGNLMWFANYVNASHADACAILTENIAQGQAIYTPAGNAEYKYVGTFDGQFHSVELAINNPSQNYQGLFGVATDGATIKNVVVKGFVNGNSYVAGIVGGSNGSEDGKTLNILNCANEATITAANANGAGIIGVNMSGAAHFFIQNCYTTGRITSGKEAGAITGWTGGDKSTIENVYSISEVFNGESVCTDFVRGGGNIINCYALEGTATNGATEVSAADVADGTLCEKLGDAFAQNAGDAYPVLVGEKGTGINAVNVNASENVSIYNLAGQRLQKMQKGINIVGGKKVLK